MRYRAQRMKKRWEEFRNDHDTKGYSHMNFGRMSLSWFLDYHYSKYKELCFAIGDTSKPFSDWLVSEK